MDPQKCGRRFIIISKIGALIPSIQSTRRAPVRIGGAERV
jgi:hypothetical protein